MTRLIALALCLVALVGCREGKGMKAARAAVSMSAQTVAQVDAAFASLYEEAALQALEACEDQACYTDAMRKWDKGVQAVNGMKLSLLAVETSLDAWEAGASNRQFHEAALCFLATLQDLDRLFDDLGVALPRDFLQRAIETGLALFNINPEADLALCGGPNA